MAFYLILPSNSPGYAGNTLDRFRVRLPHKIDLDGDWEVALVEISYPITWCNVSSEGEGSVGLYFNDSKEYRVKSIPINHYANIDELCDGLNYTLDHVHDSNNERANFHFLYDKLRQRVTLKPLRQDATHSNIDMIKLAPHLQYMLGFTEDLINPLRGKIHVSINNQTKELVIPTPLDKWRLDTTAEIYEVFKMLNDLLATIVGDNEWSAPEDSKFVFSPTPPTVVWWSLNHSEQEVDYLTFSENVKLKLGLFDDKIYPNRTYKLKNYPQGLALGKYISAANTPDVRAGRYSLFVYCDIVHPQIVGNTLAPVIRAVNINGKYGDIIDQLYDNPHYVPVLKREFDSIEININDDSGRPLNFQHGKLFVKLHFRVKQ